MKIANKNMPDARLLTDVCFVSRPQSKIKTLAGQELTVFDSFAFNPDSKTSPATARRWAGEHFYDHSKSNWSTRQVDVDKRPNSPIKLTLVDLEVRSEGGRAYKVVDEEMRQFDLREDQVLEAIALHGIQQGGKFPCDFVWGLAGSTVKLALVGGKLHTEMVAGSKELENRKTAIKNKTAPCVSNFKVGHFYKHKHIEGRALFIGNVSVGETKKSAFIFEPKKPQKQLWVYDERYVNQKSIVHGYDVAVASNKIHDEWDASTLVERLERDHDNRKRYHKILPKLEITLYSRSVDSFVSELPDAPDTEFAMKCREFTTDVSFRDGNLNDIIFEDAKKTNHLTGYDWETIMKCNPGGGYYWNKGYMTIDDADKLRVQSLTAFLKRLTWA